MHPLFSRSVAVAQLLAQAHEPPAPAAFSVDQFQQLTRRFWYNGVVATTKVVRGDPLIALHLALDMLRDCCLLALLLRDRDTGTTIHRESVVGQAFVAQLASASHPFTGRGLLTMLEQTAIAFDDLSSQWSPAYEAHRYPLLQAIDRAHRVLAEEAP